MAVLEQLHVLEAGRIRVEVKDGPFRLHVRRDGRRLVRALRFWCCDGEVEDRFVQLTEGVIARESRGFAERIVGASVVDAGERRLELALTLQGGRRATLEVQLRPGGVVAVRFEAEGTPLRLVAEWDHRDDERFAGLGARHHLRVDHAERSIQLGADRSYVGPDCPPDMLDLGGIPQGDYAPAPFVQSSRGYAVWCETDGNGTRFDLGEPVRVSVRARSGPLALQLLTEPSPAARLRRYLLACGLPALLPEWGYGFWKSRDIHEHQDDVEEDFAGCRWHQIPVDAIVLDSPWETQYNTWEPNPHQFPDFAGMVSRFRAGGVRTVVWVTPWVNLESLDGQQPPDPGSRALHREPASNYAPGDAAGHFVRDESGRESYVARWWMGTGSPVDFTSEDAERWWREQAASVLRLGVEGIKADDGEGYYFPDGVRFADGTDGAQSAWRYGSLYRQSMQAALDDVHGPGNGVLFGRSGWTGQQATGHLWAGDQASDWWSLRTLLASTLAAAATGFSNWSHDVGGYLGARGIDRCPAELLVRWAQLGAFTPLMQAHGRLQQEPWSYDRATLKQYRGAVLLHEMLVPYIRAAAWSAAAHGLPIVRPLPLIDPGDDHGWSVADAFGFGPSLWVAPVVEPGATEREVRLPRGRWIESWSGVSVEGGREVLVPAPLSTIPVWVREGALIVTYPAEHVRAGLGDTPESQRPLVATLWGEPPCGRALTRLADGTRIGWSRRSGWSLPPGRAITTRNEGS